MAFSKLGMVRIVLSLAMALLAVSAGSANASEALQNPALRKPVFGPAPAAESAKAAPPQVVSRPIAMLPAGPLSSAVPPPAVGKAGLPAPSGAEIVGNILAPHASDPDVPLPRADLTEAALPFETLSRPRIFGRGEEGGGVLGLRIPIPVRHSAFDADTRYSSPRSGSETAFGGR